MFLFSEQAEMMSDKQIYVPLHSCLGRVGGYRRVIPQLPRPTDFNYQQINLTHSTYALHHHPCDKCSFFSPEK
jgi:hypothetical protein